MIHARCLSKSWKILRNKCIWNPKQLWIFTNENIISCCLKCLKIEKWILCLTIMHKYFRRRNLKLFLLNYLSSEQWLSSSYDLSVHHSLATPPLPLNLLSYSLVHENLSSFSTRSMTRSKTTKWKEKLKIELFLS